MNIKTIVANGILAALYIAITATIAPFAFGPVQFRIPEMFNHLIVFNKKYMYGIILGVFLSNLFFSPMPLDILFGTAQSLIALLITIGAMRYVKNIWARMMINTVVFTFTMFIIAWELNIVMGWPFLFTWLTTAAGEFAVLLVGAPIIYAIHKRVNFEKLV
ncbi:QueT transporter family protein [Bacillus sp. CECT 9360]|uniref:QueT transporter family protein n=1 Tax=Bacillus sp. CECT 9360 TaxID=2845821 RepID=UPI001E48F971|nr:QueT transporter family protein [Bacillus sp. CECT 9360]CAH0345358.1 Queuosine precursor transporter QueT [Bacillus sp. CECT 9360]